MDGDDAEREHMRVIYLRVLLAKLVKRTEGERRLPEYGIYVKLVRDGIEKGLSREDAIDEAVEEAKRRNLLDGFFKIHQSEVQDMSLTEFDEEEFIRNRQDEVREQMQPIIDQQAAEIADKDRIIAELQAQVVAKR